MTGDERRIFYGRRQGRRLRQRPRALVATLLPTLTVDLSGGPIDPSALFEFEPREIWVEVGFGGGEHLAALAKAHPDVGFIGCEPFINGVAKLLSEIERNGLPNIRLVPDDARPFLEALRPASIDRFFLLFPDPWPKTRHHNRRFVSTENIIVIERIIRPGGLMCMASDHMPYIRWMLQRVLDHGGFNWLCRGPADWRNRLPDSPPTRYEQKARAKGDDCVFLKFLRKTGDENRASQLLSV